MKIIITIDGGPGRQWTTDQVAYTAAALRAIASQRAKAGCSGPFSADISGDSAQADAFEFRDAVQDILDGEMDLEDVEELLSLKAERTVA